MFKFNKANRLPSKFLRSESSFNFNFWRISLCEAGKKYFHSPLSVPRCFPWAQHRSPWRRRSWSARKKPSICIFQCSIPGSRGSWSIRWIRVQHGSIWRDRTWPRPASENGNCIHEFQTNILHVSMISFILILY